jgi:hypothetical protein
MGPSLGGFRSSALLTCSLSSGHFSEFRLGFGRKDNDEDQGLPGIGPAKITVFLDGVESYSKDIESGKKVVERLNVNGVQSIAIEVICANRSTGCQSIYFFESSLQ